MSMDWYAWKQFAEHASGFSMDELHLLAGVLLQLIVAFVLRSSIARPLPLLLVLVAELINEANDFRIELWPSFATQLGESVKDVISTMALPLLLFLAARYKPRLFRR